MAKMYKKEYDCIVCELLTCEDDLVYSMVEGRELASCECGSVTFHVVRVTS